MIFIESLLVALSTYSALPVPQVEWKASNMKYAICWFPAVGVLCGGVLWGWNFLMTALQNDGFFFAVGAVCIPLLLTGGIHMDGYMDTVDALSSHQSRERKLEILKDPHCGAFAVMYCGVYLLLQAGLFYELFAARQIAVLCPIFLLSRTLSALCAVHLPNARKAGMLCAYTKNTEKHLATLLLTILLCGCSGMLLYGSPAVGGGALLCAVGWVFGYRRIALRQFGGVTGDTSGFFLQMCELVSLIGAWVGGWWL